MSKELSKQNNYDIIHIKGNYTENRMIKISYNTDPTTILVSYSRIKTDKVIKQYLVKNKKKYLRLKGNLKGKNGIKFKKDI